MRVKQWWFLRLILVYIPDGCSIARGATVNNYGKLITQSNGGASFTIGGKLNNYGSIYFEGYTFALVNGGQPGVAKIVNRGDIDSSAFIFHLYGITSFDNYGSLIVRMPSIMGAAGDLLVFGTFYNYASGVIWYQSSLSPITISSSFYNYGKVYPF